MDLRHLVLVYLVVGATSVEMGGGLYVGRSPNGGVSFDLLGIRVNLYCTLDGNMASRDSPPFRGADVIFECGNNEVIFKARTNDYGFSYSFGSPESVMRFFPLQSNCNMVVNTSLSSCNSTLPSLGGLQSGIKFVGTSLLGHLVVANFVPKGFLYNSTI